MTFRPNYVFMCFRCFLGSGRVLGFQPVFAVGVWAGPGTYFLVQESAFHLEESIFHGLDVSCQVSPGGGPGDLTELS